MKSPHFSSSSSSCQHQEKEISIHQRNLDDDLSTISDNYNYSGDDNASSDDEPNWRTFRNAILKRPSKDSFKSILGQQVAATHVTPSSVHSLHPEHQAVYLVSEEKDEREPALLESKKVLD